MRFFFQIAMFSKWIKCTQENAVKGEKSNRRVKQACDQPDIDFALEPKCNHTKLHLDGAVPYFKSKPFCGLKPVNEEYDEEYYGGK